MSETKVVNIYKEQNYDEYIGRAGKGQDGYFGNPFKVKDGFTQGMAIWHFERYFYDRLSSDPEFKQRVHKLKGKILGCFCKPKACHGDVIAKYLNNLP